MEIKIPKEIREYTEAIFFGLSLRQFVFSILAVGMAVVLYFGLHTHLGIETVSWVCILGAAPFAALGFIRYHGLTAEQFAAAWIKSEFLLPKKLVFKAENRYVQIVLKGDNSHAVLSKLSKIIEAGQRAIRRSSQRTAGDSDSAHLA